MSERNGEAYIGRSKPVGEVRLATATKIEGCGDEQYNVDQGRADEQRGAQCLAAQQIAGGETGCDEHPEHDFARDDQVDDHDFSSFLVRLC
ncbi:hypothetical protein QM716_03280 [Rhodococcus sp. IEGM 1409]|uniref:hypothetical protein n=1 Tax=Rhodococcus sp. IEGM 1409 TaxID=3047082 RepID=UPI0024B8659D|nr:hypothetical protein [Rhodococcus sp. IEGM 1409]MDI9898871.1 hypothetical protein [Rhodococcus sp. IEGM 1409]